jgi:hypothetical protein
MALQQQAPVFNLASSPIVTKEGYPTTDLVLLLQFLIQQAVLPIPTLGTFADLPVATVYGQQAIISDSSTAVWGAVIAGGGANLVLGVWTGTDWTVMGKA